LLATRNLARVLRVILRDAVPNLVRSLGAIWRVANLARAADLTKDLAELNRRRIPMVIVWGRKDDVIPEATPMSSSEPGAIPISVPLVVQASLNTN
jgi:pimeloyl-ACP methyl ester carboxylesterase